MTGFITAYFQRDTIEIRIGGYSIALGKQFYYSTWVEVTVHADPKTRTDMESARNHGLGTTDRHRSQGREKKEEDRVEKYTSDGRIERGLRISQI